MTWVFLPLLPAGPDTYVHLLWTQQAMTCLQQGELPLWLPDLNAGFGSPGIRLYSPAGPCLAAVFGLLLGDAGRGLRTAAALAFVALLVVARRAQGGTIVSGWVWLWLASPLVPFLLFHRGAFSELYALPIAFWLLHRFGHESRLRLTEVLAWALLWLAHAPTFIMVSLLSLLATLGKRSLLALLSWARGWALGLFLVSWHWLPLLAEQSLVATKTGLVGGIFDFRRNFLGSSQAHDPLTVAALGWLALCWLAVLLMAAPRLRSEGILALSSLFLVSPLSRPLWLLLPPLAYLQFPWRFLTPASLLLPGVIAGFPAGRRKLAASLLFVLPHLWLPGWRLLPDPKLKSQESWNALGRKVHHALSANPFLVDAPQNRPQAFDFLGENIAAFEAQLVLCPGHCQVKAWRPLVKDVEVEGPGGLVRFRVLAYPFWSALLDEREVKIRLFRGTVSVWVPAGKHHLRLSWAGNPLTPLGWSATMAAALALGLGYLRRKTPGCYSPQ